MKPKLFIEKLLALELTLVATPGKLYHVNRALSKMRMVNGRKDVDDIGAAWALFAAAACPYARYELIMRWIKERKADAMHNERKDQPVTALAVILTDKNFRKELSSVEVVQAGLMKVFFKDGKTMLFPKKTAKKIEDIERTIHTKVTIPVEALDRIAEAAEIEAKVKA